MLLLCILLPTLAPAAASAQPNNTPNSLYNAASDRFHAALHAHDASPGSGAADFLAAASLYNTLITEHHLDNHTLHANRGSALLLAGDTGRAIAAFRRAQRLDPTDPAIRDALAAARARVPIALTPQPADRLRDLALAWRGYLPRPWLLAAAVLCYAATWLAASARLLGHRRATPLALTTASLAALAAAPLAIESALDSPLDQCVLIAAGVPALNGPPPGAYSPTFTNPLPPGLELRILEQRDAWLHVQLPDARDTWLPADAVERL